MSGHNRASPTRLLYLAALVILVPALLLSGCTRPRPRAGIAEAPSPSPTPGAEAAGAEEILSGRALVIGDKPDVVPGQVIVKLQSQPALRALGAEPGKSGIIATGVDNIDRLNDRFGVKGFEPLIKPVADASGESITSMAAGRPAIMGLYVVSYEATAEPASVAAAYQAEPNVVYAEPNYYVYASDTPDVPPPSEDRGLPPPCADRGLPLAFTPNDPYFDRQWNLQAIQAPQAWDMSRGQGVIVAVVDSGIAFEDFERYRRAPDLDVTNFVPGYDFVNNSPHPNDDYGHGTHVAGTIAQSTNNGRGVAGVAYGTALMPVKVLDSRGQGSFDNLAQGILFAADHGARVINLSLSGRKTSQLMTDAVKYAASRGVLIVAAAGNSDGAVEYPAAYEEILAVGSVDYQLKRAPYSDIGPEIDVVAPGGDTGVDENGDGQPDGILQETFKGDDPGKFALYYLEGTSMAAPHVAAVAALLFAVSPSATAAQVRQAIEATARDLGPAGRDNEYGYGLVQAAAAVAAMGAQMPITPTPTTPPPTETTAPPSPTTPPVTETAAPSTPTTPPVTETAAPTTPTAPAVTETTAPPTPAAPPVTETAAATTPPSVTETPPTTAGPTEAPAAPATEAPPTVTTPVVSGGEELIVNGGFEGEGGWVFSQTQAPGAYATEVVHSGQRAARLGIVAGYDVHSYSSVFQTISIPAGVRRATLTYWAYPISLDVYPNDLQLMLLLDEQFRVIRSAAQGLSNAREWVPASVDLTEYAGRTITVYFGVYNDGGEGLTTAMYVDDVELAVER